jgi:molybdenum cofactor synthesis domain-containing protein
VIEASSRRIVESAAALVIGDEILSGQIADQNVAPLAKTLRAMGVTLRTVAVVPDDVDFIAHEVDRLRAQADVVFTSGGVGPTHDDVSVLGVARALGCRVVESEELVALLTGVYGERFTPGHRLMARVPEGAELISSDGVAWPAIVCGKIWMLPGVPELFRAKLIAVRDHLSGPSPIYGTEVLTRADEVELLPHFAAVVTRYPDVHVGSYPRWFDPRYKTRVTFDGKSETRVLDAARDFRGLAGDAAIDP